MLCIVYHVYNLCSIVFRSIPVSFIFPSIPVSFFSLSLYPWIFFRSIPARSLSCYLCCSGPTPILDWMALLCWMALYGSGWLCFILSPHDLTWRLAPLSVFYLHTGPLCFFLKLSTSSLIKLWFYTYITRPIYISMCFFASWTGPYEPCFVPFIYRWQMV